jgi:DUF2075 family protein
VHRRTPTGPNGSRAAADARHEALKGIIGPAHRELLKRVKQTYRILLTRAMKGLYVWVEDAETAAHLGDMLSTAV